MPPPGEPSEYEIGVDRQSLTIVGDGATPGVWVTVLNATIEVGTVVRADDRGHYRATVAADLAQYRQNLLRTWQLIHDQNSSIGEFSVPPDCFFWNAHDADPPWNLGVMRSYTCSDPPRAADEDDADAGATASD